MSEMAQPNDTRSRMEAIIDERTKRALGTRTIKAPKVKKRGQMMLITHHGD